MGTTASELIGGTPVDVFQDNTSNTLLSYVPSWESQENSAKISGKKNCERSQFLFTLRYNFQIPEDAIVIPLNNYAYCMHKFKHHSNVQ